MSRFQTVQEAIDYLNCPRYQKWKLGLDRTRVLMEKLGNPQKGLKFVHVAGTNGKGSACAMTERILRESGYQTGLYPSPFIERFNERIQFCGQQIPDEDLKRIAGVVADAADSMEDHPSHFELITGIGMLYFLEKKCDIVVLEVGLGGEFDSTNVIDAPEVAVIMNIGLDHTELLGDTVEKIAATKSGIIKPGSSVVVYNNVPSVVQVVEEKAASVGDPVYYASDVSIKKGPADLSGQVFEADGKTYRLNLLGKHQIENARAVLKIVEALRDRGWNIPEEAVEKGFQNVTWPARFEVLSKNPVFILDGGHNPQCAEAMAKAISEYLPDQKITFLIGMLADKDYKHTLDLISPFAGQFITATPDSPRALKAEDLANEIRSRGFEAQAEEDIPKAIEKALATGQPVLAFGSLYLAGLVRTAFRERNR